MGFFKDIITDITREVIEKKLEKDMSNLDDLLASALDTKMREILGNKLDSILENYTEKLFEKLEKLERFEEVVEKYLSKIDVDLSEKIEKSLDKLTVNPELSDEFKEEINEKIGYITLKTIDQSQQYIINIMREKLEEFLEEKNIFKRD